MWTVEILALCIFWLTIALVIIAGGLFDGKTRTQVGAVTLPAVIVISLANVAYSVLRAGNIESSIMSNPGEAGAIQSALGSAGWRDLMFGADLPYTIKLTTMYGGLATILLIAGVSTALAGEHNDAAMVGISGLLVYGMGMTHLLKHCTSVKLLESS